MVLPFIATRATCPTRATYPAPLLSRSHRSASGARCLLVGRPYLTPRLTDAANFSRRIEMGTVHVEVQLNGVTTAMRRPPSLLNRGDDVPTLETLVEHIRPTGSGSCRVDREVGPHVVTWVLRMGRSRRPAQCHHPRASAPRILAASTALRPLAARTRGPPSRPSRQCLRA